MKKFVVTVVPLLSCILCFASGSDTAKNKRKDSKLEFRPVPVISYAPETRLLLGVGLLTPFKCSNDTITKHSLIAAYAVYSQNKQDYIYIPYQIFTKDNTYYIEGEVDYYNYSYYYWGTGENRVPQELYSVRFPRVAVNSYRKIKSHFYAGLDYYLEDDMMGSTVAGGSLAADTVKGSKGSITSGAGVDLLYDTRDSIFFPRHGWYIKATSNFNYPQFGSNFSFSKVVTDISWYHQLSNPIVLAVTEHNQFTWGNVPFNQLALVGGTRQLRGYYMGYYRDDILSYLQAETRVHLIGRFGFDAFGAMAFLGNYHTFPETPKPIYTSGIGLRYNYIRRRHINVRADIGFGVTHEYYLTIQEAF